MRAIGYDNNMSDKEGGRTELEREREDSVIKSVIPHECAKTVELLFLWILLNLFLHAGLEFSQSFSIFYLCKIYGPGYQEISSPFLKVQKLREKNYKFFGYKYFITLL